MEGQTKEVYYNEYCKTCHYENEPETSDKCSECLDQPYNFDSHKPINWEEKR